MGGWRGRRGAWSYGGRGGAGWARGSRALDKAVVAHSLLYSALRNALVVRPGTRGEQHRVALAVGDRVFIWSTHLVSACAELCDAASISVGDSLLAAQLASEDIDA